MSLSSKERAAFLASPTQAVAARVVGMDGKSFRNITRTAFGVYVSRGGVWDDRTRAFRLAYHDALGNAPLRAAIAAAYKGGETDVPTDVPPSE